MSSSQPATRRRGFSVRNATVFLLDWRHPMHAIVDPHPDRAASGNRPPDHPMKPADPSLLCTALRVVAQVMSANLVNRNVDAVSVIAFAHHHHDPNDAHHDDKKHAHAHGSIHASWPGVRVIRPLCPPDAAAIRDLQQVALDIHLASTSVSASPSASPSASASTPAPAPAADAASGLDKALWAARHQFTSLAALPNHALHRKRVVLLTNDDDPCCADAVAHHLCHVQARDLADMGASLQVILLAPSSSSSAPPRPARFFAPLVDADDTQVHALARGSVTLCSAPSFRTLLATVLRKQQTKRAGRKTTLMLSDGFCIGVALFALVRKAKRPAPVQLVAVTNKPLFKITTHTCESVGQVLKPGDVRHVFMSDVVKKEMKRIDETDHRNPDTAEGSIHGFSKGEITKAKAIGPLGLVMYGFRDRAFLKKELSLGPATFVFPDESKYVGSLKAFAVLHKSMLDRTVVAIVSVRRSESGSGLRFAVLDAQRELFDDVDGEQVTAGGMHMYYLPYQDDVYTMWRHEMKTVPKESDEVNGDDSSAGSDAGEKRVLRIKADQGEAQAVGIARRMVRKLKLRDYNAERFANPDLQRFYTGLQLAAGVETTFNPEDGLLNPDHTTMARRAAHLMDEVKRVTVGSDFDGVWLAQCFGTKTNKRLMEGQKRQVERARERDELQLAAMGACDVHMFEQRYHDQSLDDLTIKQLKVYCCAFGLLQRGNKRNLIMSIEDDIEKKKQKQ